MLFIFVYNLIDFIKKYTMQRTKWTERAFTFDFPEGWMYNIITRLEGSPVRLYHLAGSLERELTEKKPDGKWSIKENIGHLSDIEELHDGRIDDFISGKEVLRAADMSNAKTHNANHNSKTVQQLLDEFSEKRMRFVSRLKSLDDETLVFKSLHPRLKVPMRPVDVAFFTAEHDDHHIADIYVILGLFNT